MVYGWDGEAAPPEVLNGCAVHGRGRRQGECRLEVSRSTKEVSDKERGVGKNF